MEEVDVRMDFPASSILLRRQIKEDGYGWDSSFMETKRDDFA